MGRINTGTGTLFLILFALIAIFLVIYYTGQFNYAELMKQYEAGGEKITKPSQATGRVNDLVNSVLNEINADSPILNAENSSLDLVTSDSQEISNFGQAYDEKTF